jgi:hypothetical protein
MQHSYGAFGIHCERDCWTITGPEFVWILPAEMNHEHIAATVAFNLNDAYEIGIQEGVASYRARTLVVEAEAELLGRKQRMQDPAGRRVACRNTAGWAVLRYAPRRARQEDCRTDGMDAGSGG